MMKQLKSSLALKITAFALAVISLVAAVGAGTALIYGVDQGIYGKTVWFENGVRHETDGTFYTTQICRRLAHETAWDLVNTLENNVDVTTAYEGDYYSFDFALREESAAGPVIASTIRRDGGYGYQYADVHTYTDDTKEISYYVEIAVEKPLGGADDFYWANRAFERMLQIEPYLVPVLIASLALMLVCVVFLFCAAGHRKGREGITLNGLDKIPFDLYAAALAFGAILLMLVVLDTGGYNWYYGANLLFNLLAGAAAVIGVSVLALGIFLSFATRVKLGGCWRNTVVCRLAMWLACNGRRLWSGLGRMAHALPMIWRGALVTLGVLLIDIWLISVAQWDGGAAFVCFLFNLIVFAAIGFGMWQLRKLQKAGKELAGGNFDYKIDTKRMYWDFKKHGEDLNAIGDGMAIAVEQKMRSERLKTELITNVSHDIKTPLTSIVNYVDLLQKEHTGEEQTQYLDVLQRQSARLKKLTEDLVEASKASTGNVSANLVPTNVTEIVNQALGEYAERLAAGNLTVVTDLPEGETPVRADGRLLWRILDNLLSNVCKYAMAGTRVYVSVQRSGETVIAVKNISRQPLNVSADELMERFVRGDTARSTEGSGLGLNIARSLTELQGGTFSLYVDGDFFRAEIRLTSL